MADNGNHGGIRMWPSLETASRVSDAANWAFIASLVVGVVSTILIVWMAGVKEEHWETDRRTSRETVAKLDVAVAEANARAADAGLRAADANEKAEAEKLARVRIELQLAPRSISPDQREELKQKLAIFGGMRVDISAHGGTHEIVLISHILATVLRSASWQADVKDVTSSVAIEGILVDVRDDAEPSTTSAALALVKALKDIGLATQYSPGATQMVERSGRMMTGPGLNPAAKPAPISILVGFKP